MTKEHKKKNRCIMATDSEWDRIQAAAETLRISTSRFVIERSLARDQQKTSPSREPQGGGANMNEFILDIFRDVRVLMAIAGGLGIDCLCHRWAEHLRI